MKSALICASIIANIIVADPSTDKAPDGCVLVAVPDDVSPDIRYTYENSRFVPPKPFSSWSWNGSAWTPPKAKPQDGKFYDWDEKSQSWQVFQPRIK